MKNLHKPLNTKLMFMPNGLDKNFSIINGDITNLLDLSNIPKKSEVFHTLVDKGYANNWLPHKTEMSNDDFDYKNKLTDSEVVAYDDIISFLTFLDSLQTNNLPNIARYITNPHIVYWLARQTYEEANHSKSYGWILNSVTNQQQSHKIVYRWKENKILFERNKFIANLYDSFNSNPTPYTFIKVLMANYMLEGLYFYNGFQYFHNLASRGVMLGTDTQISYIQRDEMCVEKNVELLTTDGWVAIKDITLDSIIAQFDLETEEITFSKPLHKTYYKYKGQMYKVIDDRKNVYQNVRLGHDLVVRAKSGKLLKEVVELSKFNPYKTIPVTGTKYTGAKKFTALDAFLVALQADGYVDVKRNGKYTRKQTYSFSFNKQRKIDRLTTILTDLKVEYKIYYSKNGYTTFVVKIDKANVCAKNFDWINLIDISTEYAQQFIEELKHWDGYIPKDRDSFYYSTTNKKVFDKLCQIFTISGYLYKYTLSEDTRGEKFSDSYRISWWENRTDIQTQSLRKEVYNYNDMIGCVTMPKGTIITRTEGNVCITGNCHCVAFKQVINQFFEENPQYFNDEIKDVLYTMMNTATKQEIQFSTDSIGDKVLGMSVDSIINYSQYLANLRLKKIGLDPLFTSNCTNPYKHLETLSATEDETTNRTNNFEGTSITYKSPEVIDGWGDI